jgi:hypothetical protein
MSISDRNNTVWKRLILGEIEFKPGYMAASLLLFRLKLKVKEDKSNACIETAKNELFDLYYQSKEFPKAKVDLEILLKN